MFLIKFLEGIEIMVRVKLCLQNITILVWAAITKFQRRGSL